MRFELFREVNCHGRINDTVDVLVLVNGWTCSAAEKIAFVRDGKLYDVRPMGGAEPAVYHHHMYAVDDLPMDLYSMYFKSLALKFRFPHWPWYFKGSLMKGGKTVRIRKDRNRDDLVTVELGQEFDYSLVEKLV